MKPLLPLLALTLAACQMSSSNPENPEEVGDVTWLRDLPTALDRAEKTDKPVFLLFQEVPGCAGCKQFGNDVLSDPKTVKRIESQFLPLLIHNNKPGKDAEVRKKYHEPAWNYQVVRFLNADGKDLIPRKDRVWTAPVINKRMDAALKKAGHPQAAALKTERKKAAAPAKSKRLALCQACFWTGERKIGAIDGVNSTEAGFISGREVTLVTYDPEQTTLKKILARAEAEGVASAVYLDDPSQLPGAKKLSSTYRKAPASDQKRQIQGTPFAKLKLSPEQATKVNAYARTNPRKAKKFLSAEQRRQLGR